MTFVKGYKMTEEHKRKIGASNAVSHKGKKLSSEHRKSLSLARIRDNSARFLPHGNGAENPNWKGGTRYYRIFRRDDFTCQICGLRDPDVVEIDHKIPRKIRPDLHHDDNNLWTLCANCHRRKTKMDWIQIKAFRASKE